MTGEKDVWLVECGQRRRGVEVQCKHCGNIFVRRKNGKYIKIYCSNECRSKSQRNRKEIECWQCGKKVEKLISKAKLAKHGIHFCSRKCKDEAQKLGGCKEIQPPHFGTSNGLCGYHDRMLSRTDPHCDCGERRRYLLMVHHRDGNRQNNPPDESNWEIVCWNCHVKRHLTKVDGEWRFNTKYLTPRECLLSL